MSSGLSFAGDVLLWMLAKLSEVRRDGVSLSVIEALTYLVDRVCMEIAGTRCSGVRWIRWLWGVHSRELHEELVRLCLEGLVDVSIGPPTMVYRARRGVELPWIPSYARRAIETVVRKWGTAPTEKLLRFVESLPEIESKRLGEEL